MIKHDPDCKGKPCTCGFTKFQEKVISGRKNKIIKAVKPQF